jgi:hypothetical protein
VPVFRVTAAGFEHPQSAQDTFYVGNMKGVGRIYPANLHRHTYAKVAFAKLYDRTTPIKFQLLHLMTMTPHAFADDLLFFLRARSRRGHREYKGLWHASC